MLSNHHIKFSQKDDTNITNKDFVEIHKSSNGQHLLEPNLDTIDSDSQQDKESILDDEKRVERVD